MLSAYNSVIVWITIIEFIAALSLSNRTIVSNKPKQYNEITTTTDRKKNMNTFTTSVATTTKKFVPKTRVITETPIYRLKNEDKSTCILLKTDSVIEVSFKSHIGDETVDSFIPEDANVSGDCDDDDEAQLKLKWEAYELIFDFAKTPGGERWYVSQLKMRINTDDKHYHSVASQGQFLTLTHSSMQFPTPVGRSFVCKEENKIEMDTADFSPIFLSGKVFLRDLQMQPFLYKSDNFEAPFECTVLKNLRDETVPFIVGVIMMLAVFATIGGYAVRRYYLEQNLNYNNM